MATLKEMEIGKVFGRVTIVALGKRPATQNERKYRKEWVRVAECRCECGVSKTFDITGICDSSSCGCLTKELQQTHGLTVTTTGKKLYQIWYGMGNRCTNPKHENYRYYGGRGISVCEEWASNPKVFCKWAMDNGYAPGLSIDRIDFNGNYSPDNCRWVDLKQQARNRRNNWPVTAWGETKLMCEWMEDPRVKVKCRRTITARIKGGWWEPEVAFTVLPNAFGTRPFATKVAPKKHGGT